MSTTFLHCLLELGFGFVIGPLRFLPSWNPVEGQVNKFVYNCFQNKDSDLSIYSKLTYIE